MSAGFSPTIYSVSEYSSLDSTRDFLSNLIAGPNDKGIMLSLRDGSSIDKRNLLEGSGKDADMNDSFNFVQTDAQNTFDWMDESGKKISDRVSTSERKSDAEMEINNCGLDSSKGLVAKLLTRFSFQKNSVPTGSQYLPDSAAENNLEYDKEFQMQESQLSFGFAFSEEESDGFLKRVGRNRSSIEYSLVSRGEDENCVNTPETKRVSFHKILKIFRK